MFILVFEDIGGEGNHDLDQVDAMVAREFASTKRNTTKEICLFADFIEPFVDTPEKYLSVCTGASL